MTDLGNVRTPPPDVGGYKPPELQPKSFEEIMGSVLSQAMREKEDKEGKIVPSELAVIAELTDKLVEGGLSAEEIGIIEKRIAEVRIEHPSLEPVDQSLLSLFQTRLTALRLKVLKQAGVPEDIVPLGTTGSYLTSSAMVDFFKIITEIMVMESANQLAMSRLKQSWAMLQIKMAKEMADIVKAIGDVAAEKAMIEAAKAYLEGAMAICQAVVAASAIALTAKSYEKHVNDYKSNKRDELLNQGDNASKYGLAAPAASAAGGKTAVTAVPRRYDELSTQQKANFDRDFANQINPSADLKAKFRTQASDDVRRMTDVASNAITAAKEFIKGGYDIGRAALETQTGSLEAIKTMLQTLLESINKSVSELGADVDAQKKVQDALKELNRSIQSISERMGPGSSPS